jgi:hypothetical protein
MRNKCKEKTTWRTAKESQDRLKKGEGDGDDADGLKCRR